MLNRLQSFRSMNVRSLMNEFFERTFEETIVFTDRTIFSNEQDKNNDDC